RRVRLVAAGAAAIHAQFSVERQVFRVALDRHDVDGLGLVGVHVDHEPEVGGQVATHLTPRVAAIVRAHDVPVLLHVQHRRTRSVQRNAVDAVPDLGGGVGDVL